MEIIKKDFDRVGVLRNACTFVKDVSRLAGGEYKINGSNVTSNGENAALTGLPAKADGGYYIWVPNIAIDNAGKWNVTNGTWNCEPGSPTNAITVCKSHCGDRLDGANSEPLRKSTATEKSPYILMVYGDSHCTNLRWKNSDGSNPNASCGFTLKTKGVTANVTVQGTNIGSVERSTLAEPVETEIEYTGGTGCPNEVRLFCN
jgi:hypothetical protein